MFRSPVVVELSEKAKEKLEQYPVLKDTLEDIIKKLQKNGITNSTELHKNYGLAAYYINQKWKGIKNQVDLNKHDFLMLSLAYIEVRLSSLHEDIK